ncbi:DUF2269 domain-containing protein [Streptomyces sp. AC536]|uniref:DUF2269 domain-containing protein n=1 Tax=Streptomyces buecherae TaxID=2763006 RepID=UPI00164E71EF|nr:DUF2269 domain-containing protein [Streptomyces buecherae]MBC3984086.1 DUF2269 domain-containing protein [Streptomyces buecherae]QNJ41232.1 DUF2269 domain-containing protein [Streptomyces buecherae]
MRQLTRPTRRAVLVIHVVVSVGWLGVTCGLLTLAVAGAATDSAEAAEAAYRAMKVFGDWLVIPLSLLALVSGLVLALGTPWGLARHRWVYTKFWLNLATAGLSAFALRGHINEVAAQASAGGHVANPADVIIPPAVALATYVFITAISVLKPWGLTARGRRHRRVRW